MLSERPVAASLSGWHPPPPNMKQAQRRFQAAWGWEGVAHRGWGIQAPPSEEGACSGTYQGGPPFFFPFHSVLPQCTSCQLLLVRFWRLRKGQCGLASHSSPHLPVGRCQSRWAATVGAASGAALLATPLPGQPQECGLQCLPPAPLACVGVTSGRTPVPVYGPLPSVADPLLSSHDPGSQGRMNFCPHPKMREPTTQTVPSDVA